MAIMPGLLACSGDPEPPPVVVPEPPQPLPAVGNIPDDGTIAADGARSQLELVRELISRFDSDGDGYLSAVEHGRFAAPEPSFDALDLDASGSLDDAEVLLALELTDPGYSTRWR
jgi:hypothetical protein